MRAYTRRYIFRYTVYYFIYILLIGVSGEVIYYLYYYNTTCTNYFKMIKKCFIHLDINSGCSKKNLLSVSQFAAVKRATCVNM